MNSRNCTVFLLVSAAVLVLTQVARWISLGQQSGTRQSLSIGSKGASMIAIGPWKRNQQHADFGDDLFAFRRDITMYVLENEAVLETENDFALALSYFTSNATPGTLSKMTLRSENGIRHAYQSFQDRVDGTDTAVETHVLSKHGLTYTIHGSAYPNNARLLRDHMNKLITHFQFPDDSTDWMKLAAPRSHRFSSHEFELVFEARPAVFKNQPFEGALFNFVSRDKKHAAYAMENDGYDSPDAVLDAVFEVLCEDYHTAPLHEAARRDVKVGDVDARQLICANDNVTIHCFGIPLGERRFLDVRYKALGKPEDQRWDRDLFLSTLSVTKNSVEISFPDLKPSQNLARLNSFEEQVYSHAEVVGVSTLPYLQGCERLAGGVFLAFDNERAVRISAGEEESVYRTSEWQPNLQVVQWNDDLLATTPDGVLVRVNQGVTRPTEISAHLIAVSDTDLYFVPTTDGKSLLGMDVVPDIGPSVLTRQGVNGEQSVVGRFADFRINHLSVRGDGSRALLLVSDTPGPLTHQQDAPLRAVVLDLSSGETSWGRRWSHVRQITPAGRNWLVTGRPEGNPSGIYLLSEADEHGLLLSGSEFLGVAWTQEYLHFASTYQAELNTDMKSCLYRIALSELKPHGPLCRPFHADLFDQIARETFAEWTDRGLMPNPQTEEEIGELIGRASDVSRRLAGRELPTRAFELDALQADMGFANNLQTPAKMLLSLLLTTSLLETGASWVPSDNDVSADWHWMERGMHTTAFAIACTPAELMSYDEYRTTSLIDVTRGRRLYLGLNMADLKEVMRKAERPELNAIIAHGSAKQIVDLLSSMQENLHLRESVYNHLAALGRSDVLLDVATAFATLENAEVVDKKTVLVARSDSFNDAHSAMKLIEQLNIVLNEHPGEASLYLLLGNAHEKAHPDTPNLSRLCYKRALEIAPWGKTADQARRRLQTLEAMPSP